MPLLVSELACLLGLNFQGNGTQIIHEVRGWQTAGPASLVFCDSIERAASLPEALPCGCIILQPGGTKPGWTALLSTSPKLDFARAAALINPLPGGKGDRHLTAIVSENAVIGDHVDIGPYVHIGPEAKVGAGSILHTGVVIGEGCHLGENCILYPNTVLYPGVHLRNRVILHAGVIVGADGFGYIFDGKKQVKFPQSGQVIIDDDVEIGANTTIDRGSLGTTRIGQGSKIDNLVQIAHNVEIGCHVVIAAQTGISGSTVIEDNAVIGGQVGFGDHIRVQKGAIIGSKSGILPGKIVRGGEVYWGVPIRPLSEYKKLNALFGRLPEMKAEIDRLKKEVEELKKIRE
jgi:UDP-3-O-[3-hydroxymyristoyl] glucosamine N-acyltransferase